MGGSPVLFLCVRGDGKNISSTPDSLKARAVLPDAFALQVTGCPPSVWAKPIKKTVYLLKAFFILSLIKRCTPSPRHLGL